MAEGAALGILTFMAIIENRSYFDTLDDEVGQSVRKIDPRAKQSIYRESKADLFELVSRRKGVVLQFRKKRMSLEEVNDSVLIKIGPSKRGHLSAYRGEWVRVIWSSTYGFSMNCLVHKLKVTPEMERKLMLRGPYTKEEFTDEVAKAYPFRDVTVDGLSLVRSAKGIWISPIPTYRALKNLEMDEIPDGVRHLHQPSKKKGEYSNPTMVEYFKYAGLWIKSHASREDINTGKLDWIPVGVRVYVDRSGDIPSGWSVRTQDGWISEG
jgi:hypothetical protein